MFVKIPRKPAHIINPDAGQTFPETYCRLAVFAHGQYFKEDYKGKVCPECERLKKIADAPTTN